MWIETGATHYPQLGVPSGMARLDSATVLWAWKARFYLRRRARMRWPSVRPLELVWAIPGLTIPALPPQ